MSEVDHAGTLEAVEAKAELLLYQGRELIFASSAKRVDQVCEPQVRTIDEAARGGPLSRGVRIPDEHDQIGKPGGIHPRFAQDEAFAVRRNVGIEPRYEVVD